MSINFVDVEAAQRAAPEVGACEPPLTARPSVAIVVPAYNAARTLGRCLEALLAQDLAEPYEIIVVDDGSLDGTAEVAASYAPRVEWLQHRERRGAAAARNKGVKYAHSAVILFTDADCEPVPGWANTLLSAIRGGAAGAKGSYRTRQHSLTARFVQAEYESKYRPMLRLPSIDFIDTYSAAYRRDLLVESGGFDEGIAAVEDQELSFRLAEQGRLLRFVPEAVVYHTHPETAAAYFRKKFWIGYWKVRVAALHPSRIVRDSHTPQSIKLQMALFSAGCVALPFAWRFRAARRVVILTGVAFLASALPFVRPFFRRDPTLALAATAMLLLRAAGLTTGFMAGLWRFRKVTAGLVLERLRQHLA